MVWELFSDSFSRIVAAAQQNLPGLSAAWGTFKSAMTDFWTAVSPILSLLGVVILAVLTVVAGVVVGIINGILTAASIFMSVFDVIVTGVTNILSGIVNIVSGLLDIIVGIFTGNGDLILQGWNKIWTGIQQIVDGIFQTLVGLVAAQLGAIIGFVIGFVQGVVGFFTGLYNTLVGHSIVPDMLNAIKDWFVNVLNTVLSFVSGWVNNLVEPFRVAVSNIINFFRNTDWGAVGRGLVQGIANGISSSASGIADAARRAAQAALDAAKGFLGIHSPSTVAFQQIGVPTGEGQMLGWVAGIEDNLPDVTRSMGNLFGGQTVRMAQSDIAPMPSYVGLDGVSTETGAGGFAGGRGGSVHVTVENKPILSLGDKYEAERVLKPLLVGLLRELGVEVS
jgi:phage-related protein